MLQIATLNGAHVAGLESVTGSLTPGKRADVVLLDARAMNLVPVIDPVAAVTLGADVSNVDTVLVDGVVQKRHGKLLADTTRARQLVEAARDRLVRAAEAKQAAAAKQATAATEATGS
jgi:cytosine/adenosine deaminase-related metal-dependent hydrolase